MKKYLRIALWIIALGSTGYLLMAANKLVEGQIMDSPTFYLTAQDEIPLITEEEILRELTTLNLYYDQMKKSDLKIAEIEKYLNETNEVLEADVYTGLTSDWYIKVKTKRPIARILSHRLNDFYVNNDYDLMKLSPYSKPKVLIFTGLDNLVPAGLTYDELINNDSLKTKLKLDEIYRISSYVCNDEFYNAQIVQVHYSTKDGFLLIPRIGSQKVVFGSAESIEEVEAKFEKLTTFYEEVIPYESWDKYETINLKFKDQIVAKKN